MNVKGIESTYYLISKIKGRRFAQYKGDLPRLSLNIPMTFDEVLIGNKKNPKDVRRVTTFRDSKGEITERVFDFSKHPLRYRLYTREDYTIGDKEWVDKTTIREFFLQRNLMKEYKGYRNANGYKSAREDLTQRGQTRHNFLATGLSEDNPFKVLSSIIIRPKNQQETHEFVQFGSEPKKLVVKVDAKTFSAKTNNKEVKNDKYLGFRAYDIEDGKTQLTRYFIKDRGLENTNLSIDTDYLPAVVEEERGLISFYNYVDGSINYNKHFKFKSKQQLANTSAHETEHAWQWYLHARNTGGDTPYLEDVYKEFGPLKDKSQIAEAKEYTEAINDYVSYDVDFEKYKASKIEKLANIKGKTVEAEYDNQGISIRKMFAHIPPELL